MPDRRRARRLQVEGKVLGRVKATVPARVLDISVGGVQLEVPCALRPGAVCDLALPHGGGALRLRATVLRCRAVGLRSSALGDRVLHFRAGLEFARMGRRERAALEELIAELTRARECLTTPTPAERARIRLDSEDVAAPDVEDESA